MTTNTSKGRLLLNGLWYGGFWLLFTLWLRLALPESIKGWELHQLFRFSADYWAFFNDTPYPVLSYTEAFLTQFYLYPLLGAAIMGGLLVLGMKIWQGITQKKWPGAVWAALMLPLIPYFNLLFILVWLVMLFGGVLAVRLAAWRGWWRVAGLVLMGLLGVLLVQENILLALVFWSVIYGGGVRSWKGGLWASAFIGTGAALGIGLLFWKAYPHYYTHYLLHFILLKAIPGLKAFPSMFLMCPLFIRIISYVGWIVGFALPCAALWTRNTAEIADASDVKPANNKPKKYIKILVQSALGLVLCGMFVFSGYLNLRYQLEDYYLVYRLTAERRSAEALAVAETAFFERETPENSDKRRTLILRNRSVYPTLASKLGVTPVRYQHQVEREFMGDALRVCLLNDKQATECLFFYSGLCYFPVLFGENILHLSSQHFVLHYYVQNGLYAEALNCLYDLVTSSHISTATLEPLLWCSVVVKDYAPCRKFVRMFEQSLFHKDIARRYAAYLADTASTNQEPDIAEARLWLSSRDHTVMVYDPDDNIHFRLTFEPNHDPIYEYALSLWLVYKNYPQILAELPKIRRLYPRLPRYVQEAVAANFKLDRINEMPADIDPEIKARYIRFINAYEMHLSGYGSLAKLKKSFGDTYWFYLYFNQVQAHNPNPNTNKGYQN